ncbi:MAG: hypothetical protein ABI882_01185 [Acidobacteriota bacterium]
MSASSRKAYLIITCTFLLGLFVGLILSPLVWRRGQSAAPNFQGMVDELSVELSLNPDQRQQVEKLLLDTRQQFQDLRRQYNPQMVQIRNSSRERIGALLTAQQKTQFDQWNQRNDAKREHRKVDDPKK